jgi:hypothetical protein
VREGKLLDEAVAWCKERGLEFYAVNRDYPEETMDNNQHWSRKLKVDMFIDDRNIGGLPDWGTMYKMIRDRKSYERVIEDEVNERVQALNLRKKKKHWWNF